MALYRFEALDAQGRIRRGEIDAEGERAARLKLRAEGLVPRRLEPMAAVGASAEVKRVRVGRRELGEWLLALAALLDAGLPLAEALEALAEQEERARLRRMTLQLRRRVLEGGALAQAMKEAGLPQELWRMVRAGEETGTLSQVAARVAELIEHREKAKQRLISALLYPAIVVGFGFVVVLVLLAAVVPQITRVFAHAGAELPAITRAVIAASSFVRDEGLWLVMALLVLGFGLRIALAREPFRARWDAWLLRMPGIGRMLLRLEAARFARTLGMLLAGGVPLLDAMQVANESWQRAPLVALGKRAREVVREGGLLAGALSGLPPVVVRLVRVGEQSGRLDTMLLRAADQIERELSLRIERALTLIEPLLVLAVAVGVGLLAVAILLPLVQMNELVR